MVPRYLVKRDLVPVPGNTGFPVPGTGTWVPYRYYTCSRTKKDNNNKKEKKKTEERERRRARHSSTQQ
jgi:hypothetical protein